MIANNLISGKAVIIKNKKDYYKIEKNCILIAKSTHPELTIVINKIKAIIVEVDNKLCHAAIIAREFNKPILMGVNKATKRFKPGERLLIDLEKKSIKKIK
jgi:rifampicin phosphotransferase